MEGIAAAEGRPNIIEYDMWRLKLLNALGIITRRTRVFNVLSGIDLFPGLYSAEMWTSDKRFNGIKLQELFNMAYERASIIIPNITRNKVLPDLGALNECLIHHDTSDVLIPGGDFIQNWTSQMRPGDVVMFKFSHEHLLQPGVSLVNIKEWVAEFMGAIPEGVIVVVIEHKPWANLFPGGLGSYLMRSGEFTNCLGPTILERLDAIHANNRIIEPGYKDIELTINDKKRNILVYDAGGKISVLRKNIKDEVLTVSILVFKEGDSSSSGEQVNNLLTYVSIAVLDEKVNPFLGEFLLEDFIVLVEKTISGEIADTITVPGKIAILRNLASRTPSFNRHRSAGLFQDVINVVLRRAFKELQAGALNQVYPIQEGYPLYCQQELLRLRRYFRKFGIEAVDLIGYRAIDNDLADEKSFTSSVGKEEKLQKGIAEFVKDLSFFSNDEHRQGFLQTMEEIYGWNNIDCCDGAMVFALLLQQKLHQLGHEFVISSQGGQRIEFISIEVRSFATAPWPHRVMVLYRDNDPWVYIDPTFSVFFKYSNEHLYEMLAAPIGALSKEEIQRILNENGAEAEVLKVNSGPEWHHPGFDAAEVLERVKSDPKMLELLNRIAGNALAF